MATTVMLDETFKPNADFGYIDENNNKIIFSAAPKVFKKVKVTFATGAKNNVCRIDSNSKISDTSINFPSINGLFEIGNHSNVKDSFKSYVRVGYFSSILIGNNVTSTAKAMIVTSERAIIQIGNDCMLASEVNIRAEDSHAIYDVKTTKRINQAKNIIIEDHVWMAYRSTILSGSIIRKNSIIGFGAIAKGHFPNNTIIAGIPAKVVKKDIAWNRDKTFAKKTDYEYLASIEEQSKDYWLLTQEF